MLAAKPPGPVIRRTFEAIWLMVEFARRALAATLDAGAPMRAALSDQPAAFHVEIHAPAEAVTIELRLDAETATLAPAPAAVSSHRSRDGWLLEITSDDDFEDHGWPDPRPDT